jgi:hypothetical protein
MKAKATIAMGRNAERQGDQFLGLLRKRARDQPGFRQIAEAFMKVGKSPRSAAS